MGCECLFARMKIVGQDSMYVRLYLGTIIEFCGLNFVQHSGVGGVTAAPWCVRRVTMASLELVLAATCYRQTQD